MFRFDFPRAGQAAAVLAALARRGGRRRPRPRHLGAGPARTASHLICLTGDDNSNAEVALQAATISAFRNGRALACPAHIRNPDLCLLMRSKELAATQHRGTRPDFFKMDDQGARVIFNHYPPFPLDHGGALEPHIPVVGLNRLGQSLVAEPTHQWRNHPTGATTGRHRDRP